MGGESTKNGLFFSSNTGNSSAVHLPRCSTGEGVHDEGMGPFGALRLDGGGDAGADTHCTDEYAPESSASCPFTLVGLVLSMKGLLSPTSALKQVEGPAGNSNFLPTALSSAISPAPSSSPEPPSVPNLCEVVRFLGCSTLGGGLGSEATEAVRLSLLGGERGIGEESSMDRYWYTRFEAKSDAGIARGVAVRGKRQGGGVGGTSREFQLRQ